MTSLMSTKQGMHLLVQAKGHVKKIVLETNVQFTSRDEEQKSGHKENST